MDWQTATAWITIALAALYLGWRGWRSLRPTKGDCAGGCGCANKKPADTQHAVIPPEQLVLRKKP
jgi:hypothetical protein